MNQMNPVMSNFNRTPPLHKPNNSGSIYNNNMPYDRSKLYDMSIRDAKNLARRLFQAYDKNRSGALEHDEISHMIQDSYRGIRDNYCPERQEVEDFMQTHDRNKDGILTLQDMENTVLRYLAPELNQRQSIYEHTSPAKNENFNASNFRFENYTSNSLVKERDELFSKLSARMPKESIHHELSKYTSVFIKYDSYKNGHLDYDEVIPVLNETYSLLGIQNFNPTHSDTQRYIEKMDQNRDGRVTKGEYEVFVLKALANKLNNS